MNRARGNIDRSQKGVLTLASRLDLEIWRPSRPGMERLFSVAEANALLPRLRQLLRRVQAEKRRLVAMKPAVEGAQQGHMRDWGTPQGPAYIRILENFQESIHNIEELGVLVKDFDAGLCDFPHKRDGRVVHLCWKLDEEEIAWWHDLNSGFAGRQPL